MIGRGVLDHELGDLSVNYGRWAWCTDEDKRYEKHVWVGAPEVVVIGIRKGRVHRAKQEESRVSERRIIVDCVHKSAEGLPPK